MLADDAVAEALDDEESGEEEVKETKMIHLLSLARNAFIARGLEGSVSLERGVGLLGNSWSVDIEEGDEPTPDTSKSFMDGTASKVIEKALNALTRKSKSWRGIPFSDKATVSVSCSVGLGPFSASLCFDATASSLLAQQRKKEEELK